MYERMLNKQEMPSLEEMTAFCGCRTNSIKPFMINFKNTRRNLSTTNIPVVTADGFTIV